MDWSLRNTEVLVLDCQTTGASPAHGSLLEVGWASTHAYLDAPATPVDASVVRLPPDVVVPRAVARLTGVTPAELAEGQDAGVVWQRLSDEAQLVASRLPAERAPAVIHYARFEESFLRDLGQRHAAVDPFPFDVVCTHRVAKRLLPDLPRRSIRALAGYFGFPVDQLRRCRGHVLATAFIWHHMVLRLNETFAVYTKDDLDDWLCNAGPSPTGRRVYPMDRAKRLSLPDAPGVYRLHRANGDVLYVGKARSLKNRVNSYFQKQLNRSERHLELLSQVRDVSITLTSTATEAALLESDEIKLHSPPYNVALLSVDRQTWFFDRDLAQASQVPSEQFSVGPISSKHALNALVALASALSTAEPDQLSARARRASVGFRPSRTLSSACWLEGLARFRVEAQLTAPSQSARELLRIGNRKWRDNLSRYGVGRRPEEVAEDDDSEEWNVDDVVEAFWDVLLEAGLMLRRARWLCRISDSVIRVQSIDGEATRWVFSAGDLAKVPDAEVHARFQGRAGEDGGPKCSWDIVRYDRLRIMTTEIKRLVGEGHKVLIEGFSGQMIGGSRLIRALEWL